MTFSLHTTVPAYALWVTWPLRAAAGADLPPLLLDDDEAVAIAVALLTATSGAAGIEETAVRALAKLERVLPARAACATRSAPSRPPLPRSAPLEHRPHRRPSTLATLAAACRDHEIVTFTYRRGSGVHRPRPPDRGRPAPPGG